MSLMRTAMLHITRAFPGEVWSKTRHRRVNSYDVLGSCCRALPILPGRKFSATYGLRAGKTLRAQSSSVSRKTLCQPHY